MAGLLSWGSIYPLGMYFKNITISGKKEKKIFFIKILNWIRNDVKQNFKLTNSLL